MINNTAILIHFNVLNYWKVIAATEVYSEPCQKSKMELFEKIVND